MKVLLRDLDVNKRRRPFPNLALMKLSAYHKARGDEVWLNFPLCQPDITYTSCVFTWNGNRRGQLPPDAIVGGSGIDLKAELPPDAIVGGSGIDLKAELPPEVEHIKPDYLLYPNVNFSLGYTSRGCIRRCPWCNVPKKEGGIKAWASVYEFLDPSHNKIVLLDNNILASPNWAETFAELMAIGLEVDFNQGLDIRLLDDETVWRLSRLRTKALRFAFDDISYEASARRGIDLLTKQGIRSRKLSFYVLVGFDGDETALERMRLLHSYNVNVYPMLYKGKDGKEPPRKIFEVGEIFWHGSRRNINKFLRVVGRLPE